MVNDGGRVGYNDCLSDRGHVAHGKTVREVIYKEWIGHSEIRLLEKVLEGFDTIRGDDSVIDFGV